MGATKTDNRRFTRGSGVYKCRSCERLTRATGHDEEAVELCFRCCQEAGLENMLSDGTITRAEYDSKMADVAAGLEVV